MALSPVGTWDPRYLCLHFVAPSSVLMLPSFSAAICCSFQCVTNQFFRISTGTVWDIKKLVITSNSTYFSPKNIKIKRVLCLQYLYGSFMRPQRGPPHAGAQKLAISVASFNNRYRYCKENMKNGLLDTVNTSRVSEL